MKTMSTLKLNTECQIQETHNAILALIKFETDRLIKIYEYDKFSNSII